MPPRMSLAKDQHQRAGRALVCALTLGDHAAWMGLAKVLRLRLSDEERAALCFAVTKSLTSDQAGEVMATAYPQANSPLPKLENVMHDARWWAGFATEDELKAYAVAIHEAMSSESQSAFLEWASKDGRAAA